MRPLLVFSPLTLLLILGCSPPPEIQEMTVSPEVVCPGENVEVRVITRDFDAARLTADPAPAAGLASRDIGRTEVLTSIMQEYSLCDSTAFLFKAWKAAEIDCSERGLVACRSVLASVVVGSETQTIRVNGCSNPGFPGRAVIEIADRDYTRSLIIDSIVNCGGRNLILSRNGGTPPETAGPGESFASFVGRPWVGTWTGNETVWPGEACDPTPRSRAGEPIPPVRPRPPEICVAFTVSCPDSGGCEG